MALLLCAASFLIASEGSRSLLAADTEETSFTPFWQSVHPPPTMSTAPPAQLGILPHQAIPYQLDLDTNEPGPQGAQEYMESSEQVSVFGIEMCVDRRMAEREIQGLLVIDVEAGSPGALAGLRPPVRSMLSESYDLIIGIDSARVANFVDLWKGLRMVQPGEVVYFSLLRDGHRMQLPIKIWSALPMPQTWVR
jgi:PDZ domain